MWTSWVFVGFHSLLPSFFWCSDERIENGQDGGTNCTSDSLMTWKFWKKKRGFGMTLFHDISRKFMEQTLDLHKFVKEFTLSIEIWVHKHNRRGLVLSSDGCGSVIYLSMLVGSLMFASLDQIVPVLVFHGHCEVLLLPFSSPFFVFSFLFNK